MHGKLADVAPLKGRDLAHSLLLHLIDPQHRMQRQVGALDPLELALDTLFPRIQDHRGALAEHQILHFQEAEQRSVGHFAGVNFINFALIHEHNLENVTGCHGVEAR